VITRLVHSFLFGKYHSLEEIELKLNENELLSTSTKPSNPYFQILNYIIVKTFKQYFDITDNIRGIFSSKLWRMGKLLAKLGA